MAESYFPYRLLKPLLSIWNTRKIDVSTKEIVEGRWNTIRAHLNHLIEYVGEKEKAANLGIKTLVKFEWKGKETNYVLFRTEQGASK